MEYVNLLYNEWKAKKTKKYDNINKHLEEAELGVSTSEGEHRLRATRRSYTIKEKLEWFFLKEIYGKWNFI